MSGSFVADSSIGVAWVHPSQATELTAQLLADVEAGAAVHVPSLWPLEVSNALLAAVRRKLMTDGRRELQVIQRETSNRGNAACENSHVAS